MVQNQVEEVSTILIDIHLTWPHLVPLNFFVEILRL